MNRRDNVVRLKQKTNWRIWLSAIVAIVSVLSAIVYFARDAIDLADEIRPGPGSLIVNINTATPSELETVPGIGPGRAAQIIVGRPYESVDELIEIAGIGEETLESMRPFIVVEGETRRRERSN